MNKSMRKASASKINRYGCRSRAKKKIKLSLWK